MLDRRSLLIGASALGMTLIAPLTAYAADPELVDVPLNNRQVSLSIWRPATVKGVVLFSHGGNSSLEPYAALFNAWRDAGYLVVAPLHTDSLKNDRAQDHGLQAAFSTRIEDLAAASAWAMFAVPGKPMAAVGHSYGSLTAMTRGGVLEQRIGARDPNVKAVIAFSTPGGLSGLVDGGALATLNVPLLLVTGDQDLVPGFVTDWHEHLAPFDGGPPAGRMAWIGKGVDHKLAGRAISDPMLADAAALSITFLDANVLGDAAAKARLAKVASTDKVEIRRRQG